MFEKIKSFFSAPEPEKIELDEKGLRDWLDKEIKGKTETFKTRLKEIEKEIEDLKKSVLEKLDELEGKKIEDVRVPVRIKNKFEGNKISFRKNIEYFFPKLPSLKGDEDLRLVKENLDKILDELNKVNHKPALVLKNFFSNEVMEIGNNIKSIENCYKKAMEAHEGLNLGILKQARENLNEYYNEKERIKQHNKNINQLEKELENLEKENKKIKNEIKNLENNSEYKKLLGLINEKESIEKKIRQEKEEVRNYFSTLGQAIKKFSRSSLDEEVGNSFSESIDDTFLLFDKKRIIDFLKSLQSSLEKGSLELKEKKREKSILFLKKLDPEYIETFKAQVSNLEKRKDEIEKIIDDNDLLNEHAELNNKLEQLEHRKKKKLEEINLEKSKEDKPKAKTPKNITEELDEKLDEINLIFTEK